jgi:hypothetical protein
VVSVEITPPFIVVEFDVNMALIVWFAVTFVNVYVLAVATEEPSTDRFEREYPVFGVMVKVCVASELTLTAPNGDIVPLAPADEVMV